MNNNLLLLVIGAVFVFFAIRLLLASRTGATPAEARAAVAAGTAVIVDVREPAEWASGTAEPVAADNERYRQGGPEPLRCGSACEFRPAFVAGGRVDPEDPLSPVGIQARAAAFRVVLRAVDTPCHIAGGDAGLRSPRLQQGYPAFVAAGQRRTGQFENLAQRFLQALLSHQDLGQGDERFLRLPWSGHGALTADRIIGGLVRDTRWRNE